MTETKVTHSKELQDFLQEMYFDLNGDSVEIRKIHPSGNKSLNRTKYFKSRLIGLTNFVNAEIDKYNIYFGVATRDGKGGTKQNVKSVLALWAETDSKDFDGNKQAALDAIKRFPLEPSIVVDSGHGWHFYWLLKELYQVESGADIVKIEGYLYGIADQIGGDISCTEIARIMRLPGTFNIKDSNYKLKCRSHSFKPTLRYNLPDFDDYYKEKAVYHEHSEFEGEKFKSGSAIMVEKCRFMKYAVNNFDTISYDEFFTATCNLVQFDDSIQELHKLVHSRLKEKYSPESTDYHLSQIKYPRSCFYIQNTCKFTGCQGCQFYGKEKKAPISWISRIQEPGVIQDTRKKAGKLKSENTKINYDFPFEIISGIAGDFARLYSSYLESPIEFFYISMLTLFGYALCDKLTLNTSLNDQARLYTLILGESADDRKSTALNKTVSFFNDCIDELNICRGLGSAEGLQQLVNSIEKENKKIVLFYDEFKQFVSKCNIQGSVLLPCINSLFHENEYDNATKKTNVKLEKTHISLLAASTIDTYQQCWNSVFTGIGFNNRLFIVPGKGERKYSIPKKIPEQEVKDLKRKIVTILARFGLGHEFDFTKDAKELYHDWYINLKPSVYTKRLDTYAFKFMMLLAVNDDKEIIDREIIEKVIKLMNWQLHAREQHDPIDSENTIAKLEETIRRLLRKKDRTERELKQFTHYNTYGIYLYNAAKNNLVREKEIRLDSKSKLWCLVE